MCPAMRWGATTIKCCVNASRSSRSASICVSAQSPGKAPRCAPLPIPRRYSKKPLAARAGLGWIGKHSLVLNRDAGSWFFLGELFTTLDLPLTGPEPPNHCGACKACITVCPTRAIVAPGELDASRCISYLTIEHRGAIPVSLRPAIGNRIFGCDDCQLYCPWNRSAPAGEEADFLPRNALDSAHLLELFAWDQGTWERSSAGSALRRISYAQWRRNLAVALGNAPPSRAIYEALRSALPAAGRLEAEHIAWALHRQGQADASDRLP